MLFRLRNVVKQYGRTAALRIDSLDIEAGVVTGFTGPNGAGKSTLLQVLAGLMEPTSGTVSFDGNTMYPDGDLDAARKRVTYLAQNPILFQMSVRCNVAYGLKLRGAKRANRLKAADEALESVGLLHLAERRPRQLSAGEKQRIAMARALCLEPDVLILDEPTANVDRENIGIIEDLIRSMQDDGGTSTIIASHDHLQVGRLCDRFVALDAGRLAPPPFENVFPGTIEERDGAFFFAGAGGIEIELVARRTGRAKIAVQPNEIILSRTRLDSSMRNSFPGTIRYIASHPDGGVCVTVDAGLPFAAAITKHSLEEMAFAVGDEVFVSFKSAGVIVF